jgi:DNA-directed RNA polymerase I subunit RPA1
MLMKIIQKNIHLSDALIEQRKKAEGLEAKDLGHTNSTQIWIQL